MKKISIIILTMYSLFLTGCVDNIKNYGNERLYTKYTEEKPKRLLNYKPEVLSSNHIVDIKKELKERLIKEGYYTYGESREVIAFQKDNEINSERVYFSINNYENKYRILGDIYLVLNPNTEDEIIKPNTTADNIVLYQMILEDIK